jgi:hypothetical protein
MNDVSQSSSLTQPAVRCSAVRCSAVQCSGSAHRPDLLHVMQAALDIPKVNVEELLALAEVFDNRAPGGSGAY